MSAINVEWLVNRLDVVIGELDEAIRAARLMGDDVEWRKVAMPLSMAKGRLQGIRDTAKTYIGQEVSHA